MSDLERPLSFMQHERPSQAGAATTSKEVVYTVVIAGLAALLIAASNVSQTSGASLLGAYAYWMVRIAIEGTLFILVRDALERTFAGTHSAWKVNAAAILVSLVPFVLAITALDIVLGYPELGAENAAAASTSKFKEFGLELIYLLDNHVILCVLLTIPRWLLAEGRHQDRDSQSAVELHKSAEASRTTMFTELDPPLKGDVVWAEAREHYVRLTTTEESRMVLNRFTDVLRDLPDDAGIQVHRSHWVSINAVKEAFREGANLRLRLETDDVVPVSRSYRAATERRLKDADLMA